LRPIAGTPGERYLRDVRAIDCDAIADVLGEPYAIGWHPSVYFGQPNPEKPFHEFDGQRFGAIARTYIHPDGWKIGKGKSLAGSGIVRLSRDEDVLEGLHLTEGLESALYVIEADFLPM
jgi:hypothetical protein